MKEDSEDFTFCIQEDLKKKLSWDSLQYYTLKSNPKVKNTSLTGL